MAEAFSFKQIFGALCNNSQFQDGAYGPQGESPLTREEKSMICGKITKDLRTIFDLKGDAYLAELWIWLKPELGKANWFLREWGGKKKDQLFNHIAIWRMIYKRASKTTEAIIASRPKPIQTAIKEAVQEIPDQALQDALKKSGAMDRLENFE